MLACNAVRSKGIAFLENPTCDDILCLEDFRGSEYVDNGHGEAGFWCQQTALRIV